MKNRRVGAQKNGYVELDSEPKEEVDEEQDVEERYPSARLISYLNNRGSTRVQITVMWQYKS